MLGIHRPLRHTPAFFRKLLATLGVHRLPPTKPADVRTSVLRSGLPVYRYR
jgi:hypothetical protein